MPGEARAPAGSWRDPGADRQGGVRGPPSPPPSPQPVAGPRSAGPAARHLSKHVPGRRPSASTCRGDASSASTCRGGAAHPEHAAAAPRSMAKKGALPGPPPAKAPRRRHHASQALRRKARSHSGCSPTRTCAPGNRVIAGINVSKHGDDSRNNPPEQPAAGHLLQSPGNI